MARPRIYFPRALAARTEYELDSSQTQYIARSLRLRVGDSLDVFDGTGPEFAASILRIDRRSSTIVTGEAVESSLESPLSVCLMQAISKGERMDIVVQKATELGVNRIIPVVSENGVVKLDDSRALRRKKHWQRIAQSACEQCGRNIVPEIETPIALIDTMAQQMANNESKWILHTARGRKIRDMPGDTRDLTLLIGPEGGFSNAEYERAEIAGFKAVSLGPRVLRTETAAIAALAIIQSRFGDA